MLYTLCSLLLVNASLHLSDGLSPEVRTGRRGLTVWMTGRSGSGKTTIAVEVVRQLNSMNQSAYRLDGDNLRKGLNNDLTFSAEHRSENNRRAAEVAKLFNDGGMVVLCALIAPFEQDRASARAIHENDGMDFIEVHVDAPLAVTESRDVKGLYKKARSGEIKDFTGLSSPYDEPTNPDLHLHTDVEEIKDSVRKVMETIQKRLGLAPVAVKGSCSDCDVPVREL